MRITTIGHRLQEVGSRLGNSPKIVDQVCLRHADASVLNRDLEAVFALDLQGIYLYFDITFERELYSITHEIEENLLQSLWFSAELIIKASTKSRNQLYPLVTSFRLHNIDNITYGLPDVNGLIEHSELFV